jgi:hypothetical protein
MSDAPDRPLVRLTLRLPPGRGADACLKRFLKMLGRAYGLTCLRVEDVQPEGPRPEQGAESQITPAGE